MNTATKLAALRQLMQQHQIDFYFVPARDAHNNEYVPLTWQRRAWISAFTGSAGDALIGLDSAYLWTDPRYFLQAELELDKKFFQLMKQQPGMSAPIPIWLNENAKGKRVGVDPRVMDISNAQQWQTALQKTGGELVAITKNLIDALRDELPPLAHHPIKLQDVIYAGVFAQEKLSALRQTLKLQNAEAHVITMLDAIAWLFNIRGSDIHFNPLVISYAIVTQQKATLFIDLKKTNPYVDYFKSQNIELAHYDDFANVLQQLKDNVLVETNTASWWVEQQLKNASIQYSSSPITLMKAIKNPTEQNGMRTAHRYDAIAMVKFFHWLEKNWQGQTELTAATQLENFRRENPHCLDLSFDTISGFAEHGAIIHYRVTPETDTAINDRALFLIDSGGQYREGTTDITRTIHLGTPSAEEKRHYTLVLKGHIALSHAVFVHGTCGEHLDCLAHLPLWQNGLDYGHGTGHGVGSYLCVHEGPQRISRGSSNIPLIPGMVVSNEPGVYFEHGYGIRIENLCLVIEATTQKKISTGHGPFYTFEDLTLVPYARNLIDKALLNDIEIKWINTYHEKIKETLQSDVDTSVYAWLTKATEPL